MSWEPPIATASDGRTQKRKRANTPQSEKSKYRLRSQTQKKRRHTHSPVGRREQAVTRNMQYNQHRCEIVSPPKREARNVVPDPSATREAKTQPMRTPRSFARREYQNRLILNICCSAARRPWHHRTPGWHCTERRAQRSHSDTTQPPVERPESAPR